MSFAPRELSPARLGRNVRLVLARRPWIRWLAVALIAAGVGAGVHTQLRALDETRAQWTEQRRVAVATAGAGPGDELAWEWRTLPAVAVPPDAVAEVADGAHARQHIGVGEVVVGADLAVGTGPAAGATAGHVVVPVSDPLVEHASVGLDVAVYSDGLTLAGSGRIVHAEAGVLFVEVLAADAAMVAAAAQTRQASIAFLAPA